MQSKCLELNKREKKSRGNKDAEQLLKVRRREKELRKKGCREFA